MQRKLSKEDRDTITRGEMLRSLVESDGWKIAISELNASLEMLESVSTFDTSMDPVELSIEVHSRNKAIRLFRNWQTAISEAVEMYYEQIQAMNEEEDDIIKEM
jgi:hypothetical protein